MKPWLLFASFAVAVAATHAYAACMPTPAMSANNYPGARNIVPSNDLTLPAGKAVPSTGQRLIVHGTVRDRDCIPLQGAVVEMWQATPFGAWRLASPEDRVNTAPVFSGAGRTVTDNEGNFHFITVFPGPVKGAAPRLHFRILPEGGAPLTTLFFFENDARNASDPLYKKLKSPAEVTLRMQKLDDGDGEGFMAIAPIVVPFASPYRGY